MAASAALRQLHERGELAFYIDCHGHATKRGCFLYGNGLPPERQLETVLYAKLVALNSRFFDFGGCVFYLKNNKKDKAGETRRSGRVAVYKMTDMTYCYTLECNYNMGASSTPRPATSPPARIDTEWRDVPEPPRPRGRRPSTLQSRGRMWARPLASPRSTLAAPTPPRLGAGRRHGAAAGVGRRMGPDAGAQTGGARREGAAAAGSSDEEEDDEEEARRRRTAAPPAWRPAWAERSEEREGESRGLGGRRTHTVCRSVYKLRYGVCRAPQQLSGRRGQRP